MGIKLKQRTTHALLCGMLLISAAPAMAQELDVVSQDPVVIIKTYFSYQGGFDSAFDLGKWQEIQGLVAERQYKEAAEELQTLVKKYPEKLNLKVRLADAYLYDKQASKALTLYDGVEAQLKKKQENKDGYSHFLLAQAQLGKINALRAQGRYQAAMDYAHAQSFNDPRLNAREQVQIYHSLAQSYHHLGQYDKAYQALKMAAQVSQDNQALEIYTHRYTDLIADQKYQQALNYYRLEDYGKTLETLDELAFIVAADIKHSRLKELAHQRFIEEARNRLKRVQPYLLGRLRVMRDNIMMEEYDELYRNYQALQRDRDMAFFLDPKHQYYLPYRLRKSLTLVEESLVHQGYKI